jgi:membrane-associated phospholipid phosphatase
MVPIWAKNILFLLVYMISGLVLVIIIEGLLSGTDLILLNTAIERLVVEVRSPYLTTFLVAVTRIGNPFVFSSLSVFIAVMLFLRGRRYEAALLLATLFVAVVSLTVLNNIFQIQRPLSGVYGADGWSFPSGHATVATTFFFLIAYVFFGRMRTIKKKTFLIIGSVVGTALVCFSRLYLGAHWTLDILAGIVLGLLSVSFTVLMFNLFFGDRRSVRKIVES